MTEPTIETLKATVHFSRKVNLGDYQSADYGVFIPVEIPPELAALLVDNPAEGRVQLAEALREAWLAAKGSVFEQAGLPMKYDKEGGVLAEVIEANFPGTKAENGNTQARRSGSSTRVGQKSSGGASRSSGKPQKSTDDCWAELVESNGEKYFDNRADKRNPKAPDFKRKGTGEGLWLDRAPDFVVEWLNEEQF